MITRFKKSMLYFTFKNVKNYGLNVSKFIPFRKKLKTLKKSFSIKFDIWL